MSTNAPPTALIGHAWARRVLDNAADERRVRHAYLFHGPARVGKSTFARWFAMRLNCQRAESPPCGACPACVRILRGRHPDVRSLQAAADHDESLGMPIDSDERSTRATERALSIGQIRALQHDAAMSPNEAAWKVYVVVGAESLTLPAANALLKTLEEPPRQVVLVLTVADRYDLPATVVSRCQTVRFPLVPVGEIAAALEAEHGCPPDRAALLARLSGGRPGWAIDALTDELRLRDRAQLLDELEPSTRDGFREQLALAEKIASGYSRDPGSVQQSLALWRVWWWDVFLIQSGCADIVTNVDRRDALDRVARGASPGSVADFIRRLGDASLQLTQNVNPRLALENVLINTPAVR